MILQQELIREDPSGWRMLVGCILLNLTHRRQVDPVYPRLFSEWPSPELMANASLVILEDELRPLGLQHRRAATLKYFSRWWTDAGGSRGYPKLGQWVGRDPGFGERIRALEPPGIGDYARDSWAIFAEGIVPDWEVRDKELRKHLGLEPLA